MDEPVFLFRDEYQPDSYWWDDYLGGALPLLGQWGWLSRSPLTNDDLLAVKQVIDGIHGMGLDEDDCCPFGLLWALRSTGALTDVPGLDDQLLAWRLWEETDHLGEPLTFLPDLS